MKYKIQSSLRIEFKQIVIPDLKFLVGTVHTKHRVWVNEISKHYVRGSLMNVRKKFSYTHFTNKIFLISL